MSIEGHTESDSQLDAQLNIFLQQIIAQEDLSDGPFHASTEPQTTDLWPPLTFAASSLPAQAGPLLPQLIATAASQQTITQPGQPLYTQYNQLQPQLQPQQQSGQQLQQQLQQQSQQQLPQQHSVLGSGSSAHGNAPSSQPGGAIKRSQAWCEKNRRAQQRFRERQKAHKLELQQQIAEKVAAAKGLQAEHAQLVARNSMLEKVLDTQQTSVNILQGNDQEPQTASTPKPFSTSSQHQQPALQGLHHTHQGIPFMDTQTLDEDDDYCKTYAVLVEGLKQLLNKLDTEGVDANLHLQLQNQTRAAGYCMKQALLMNPDSMQDLLMGTTHQPSIGTGHTSFTSRRDWQSVTVSHSSFTQTFQASFQRHLSCIWYKGG
ncbi:TPA: hypothetical protein ACH3X1_011783 [Trebouxia sp. C0004]